MKIAVIYNRDSKSVINLFGIPNRERYGKKSIARIVDALKSFGHQVRAIEGDKELIGRLEEFMPQVLKGERPGLAFNLSYGIQGQARYTHVPGILEMVGIPYVGSNPLAHSLALDKVVAKMIFRQNGLSTPDFVVFKEPGFSEPDIPYPLIVKPKNEAVSMGIRIVKDFEELKQGVEQIFQTFGQPVLVEQYIAGKEINVGLLGNNPSEVLPPCQIDFGESGPAIYTIEDKKGKSGRTISWHCPAPIGEEATARAQDLAREAFAALGCYDMARVDMRMDDRGQLYILEINSLPSLGEHGSFVIAARHIGLDFPHLVHRMVEVASARYFGTPNPPSISPGEQNSEKQVFSFITSRRDQMEKNLKEWVDLSSRTSDPVGLKLAANRLEARMKALNLKPVRDLSDKRSALCWETSAGLRGGTLLVGHLDIPLNSHPTPLPFRREPEWLYGEGIGNSRAPLVMLDFCLRALRSVRRLQSLPLGVLYYMDEGRDARYSEELIREAAARSRQVLVLRPGGLHGEIFIQRRGQRKYDLTIEGQPRRLGHAGRKPDVLQWTLQALLEMSRLSSRKNRVAVSADDLKTESFPLLIPHRVKLTLLVSYLNSSSVNAVEAAIRGMVSQAPFSVGFELISDRPPMKERKMNLALAKSLERKAEDLESPLNHESSLWPSVAGVVTRVPVLCGMGPAARDLYTHLEAVNRISLIQRTLLLAQWLLSKGGAK